MNRNSFVRIAACCSCGLILGCDSGTRGESGATVAAFPDTVSVSTSASRRTDQSSSPCPRTGRWAACSVEKRLEQSGFVPKKQDESLTRSGFSVQPVAYTLGRARLEVFIYPDEAALSRDVAKLDTALAAPRGQTNGWEIPPRFVRSANLAAVLLTRNEQQAERVTLALTAGPPQSGR